MTEVSSQASLVNAMFEELITQAHDLRCMALVAQEHVSDIMFPGMPDPKHPAYYYIGDVHREVTGFSVSNVFGRAVVLEEAVEALFDAVRASQ